MTTDVGDILPVNDDRTCLASGHYWRWQSRPVPVILISPMLDGREDLRRKPCQASEIHSGRRASRSEPPCLRHFSTLVE